MCGAWGRGFLGACKGKKEPARLRKAQPLTPNVFREQRSPRTGSDKHIVLKNFDGIMQSGNKKSIQNGKYQVSFKHFCSRLVRTTSEERLYLLDSMTYLKKTMTQYLLLCALGYDGFDTQKSLVKWNRMNTLQLPLSFCSE